MKTKTLIIASALLFGVIASANAEDEVRYYYDDRNYGFGEGDVEYQIPQSYRGEYYPEEREPQTGYYGIQRDSKNTLSNDIRENPDGYYNYYY